MVIDVSREAQHPNGNNVMDHDKGVSKWFITWLIGDAFVESKA